MHTDIRETVDKELYEKILEKRLISKIPMHITYRVFNIAEKEINPELIQLLKQEEEEKNMIMKLGLEEEKEEEKIIIHIYKRPLYNLGEGYEETNQLVLTNGDAPNSIFVTEDTVSDLKSLCFDYENEEKTLNRYLSKNAY